MWFVAAWSWEACEVPLDSVMRFHFIIERTEGRAHHVAISPPSSFYTMSSTGMEVISLPSLMWKWTVGLGLTPWLFICALNWAFCSTWSWLKCLLRVLYEYLKRSVPIFFKRLGTCAKALYRKLQVAVMKALRAIRPIHGRRRKGGV